jgi:4,5-dihydroxyphthalate decarboxylase
MSNVKVTLACWDYDRTRALMDGTVKPAGIDLTYLNLPVEETFFRMLRFGEFDACELSLSSYTMSLMQAEPRFIAIPVFPSRFFRHSCIFVSRQSGITEPRHLIGKRIGVPEYQMTAPVWIRGILKDEYGVEPSSVHYFTGGEESPGREEKLKLNLPPEFRVTPIGPAQTLSRMIADGELDAFYTARAPSTFYSEPDKVARLFPDYPERERDYYRRSKIFPIMHVVAIKRDLYKAHPWIARSLFDAFRAAQRKAYDDLHISAALKTMLPWQIAMVEEVEAEMGVDWWSYGLTPANRAVLATFLRYHREQGLSSRVLEPEQLFAPESLAEYTI